jgi:fructokinase
MALRVGIDVGGTKIEGIALDGGAELARVRVETPRNEYAATLEAIGSVVAELERRIGARGTVGVGIPGALSPSTGLVKNANSVWLIGQPLLADLQTRLQRDVRIANDADCFAVSEAADGAAAGATVVFGVIVGTGTGAGVVVRGEVISGPNAVAGEWGHNPLPWATDDERPGPVCYCGRNGCIETFLSGPGLTGDYQRRTGRRETPEAIAAAAGQDPPYAEEALSRYEHRMARALASVINVLDPDVIVLGGGMSKMNRLYANVPRLWGEFVFSAIRSTPNSQPPTPNVPLEARSLGVGSWDVGSFEPVRTRLVRARYGDSSGVRGAAWLWPSG